MFQKCQLWPFPCHQYFRDWSHHRRPKSIFQFQCIDKATCHCQGGTFGRKAPPRINSEKYSKLSVAGKFSRCVVSTRAKGRTYPYCCPRR